jgi:hypothetical protein
MVTIARFSVKSAKPEEEARTAESITKMNIALVNTVTLANLLRSDGDLSLTIL